MHENYREQRELVKCSYCGYLEKLNKLLEENPDINVNYTDYNGEIAIVKASREGSVAVVKRPSNHVRFPS